MDRAIVWPGAIPQDTDLLNTNRNAMVAIGRLAQDVLGSTTAVSGLACSPTSPASMAVGIGAGAIYSLASVDSLAYGSLGTDTTDSIVKQGILQASANATLTMTAPTTSGYSVIYLIEAQLSEADGGSTVLPYYNSSNPAVPWSGPSNSGAAQYTNRHCTVALQAKAGVAAASPVAPSADSGWVPLYTVTIAYGQTSITSANIAVASGAPFINTTLGGLTSALSGYLTSASAASTYATIASLSSYLTASAAAAAYAPLAGAIKAKVSFVGSTGTIRGTPTNVSSITRTASGIYKVNLTSALADTNYVLSALCTQPSSGQSAYCMEDVTATRSTSQFGIQTFQAGVGAFDPAIVNVLVF